MAFVGLVVMFAACPWSGCGAEPVFNSRSAGATPVPMKRLLVVARMESRGFNHDMKLGFEAALSSRLSTCGVATAMQHSDLDPAEQVSASAKELGADAILRIRTTDRGATDFVARGSHATFFTWRFELQLVDAASGKVLWIAKSELTIAANVDSDSDTETGMGVGTSVVSRLRDDRVLAGCPDARAGWPTLVPPDCMEKRHRILVEAKAQTEKLARMKMIESAPRCR